jgi:hypothetical protein
MYQAPKTLAGFEPTIFCSWGEGSRWLPPAVRALPAFSVFFHLVESAASFYNSPSTSFVFFLRFELWEAVLLFFTAQGSWKGSRQPHQLDSENSSVRKQLYVPRQDSNPWPFQQWAPEQRIGISIKSPLWILIYMQLPEASFLNEFLRLQKNSRLCSIEPTL